MTPLAASDVLIVVSTTTVSGEKSEREPVEGRLLFGTASRAGGLAGRQRTQRKRAATAVRRRRSMPP